MMHIWICQFGAHVRLFRFFGDASGGGGAVCIPVAGSQSRSAFLYAWNSVFVQLPKAIAYLVYRLALSISLPLSIWLSRMLSCLWSGENPNSMLSSILHTRTLAVSTTTMSTSRRMMMMLLTSDLLTTIYAHTCAKCVCVCVCTRSPVSVVFGGRWPTVVASYSNFHYIGE